MNDALIYCPNNACQTPNSDSNQFCQRCRTFLPKRYLWVVGATASPDTNHALAERYAWKDQRIVLDTRPGLPPEAPSEPSDPAIPYLRLFAHRLHIPQVYAAVQVHQGSSLTELLLLEQAPINVNALAADQGEVLFPTLLAAWPQASALRQLNWLWQMAQLWQPCQSVSVASSLLQPELLRVEGAFVRLLELELDPVNSPTLSELGQLWSIWTANARPEIAEFLALLCQKLITGKIPTADQLVTCLEEALRVCGQTQSRRIQITTCTDQGPTRQRNEDACYPPSGTTVDLKTQALAATQSTSAQNLALTIVCDGIGGHEGGSIASHLAITSIQQQLQNLDFNADNQNSTITTELTKAVYLANDLLCQRNDAEQRQQRQRMGTTVVIALAQAHAIYITHLGDSRVYCITRTGCYQITLDDDLASRDVRLGYSFYREALQNPVAGSLVQALGMGSSAALYPTTQQLILDEDCVFLLCSDGLSDNDRVEEHWHELLPILDGTTSLATASQRLVEIANTENGHDNVTVSLVHCQVATDNDRIPPDLTEALLVLLELNFNQQLAAKSTSTASTLATQLLPTQSGYLNQMASVQPTVSIPTQQASTWRPLLLSGFLVLGLSGGLAYWLVGDRFSANRYASSPAPSAPVPQVSPTLRTPNQSSVVALTPGSLVEVTGQTNDLSSSTQIIPLISRLTNRTVPTPVTTPTVTKVIPVGTVLRIMREQTPEGEGVWLRVKVCSLPSSPVVPPAFSLPQIGEIGWIQRSILLPAVGAVPEVTQFNNCPTLEASPIPTPVPPSE